MFPIGILVCSKVKPTGATIPGNIYMTCIVLLSPINAHTFVNREGDKLVPSVQKKINELEVGLLHLQQNIDIPEISLPIHATIVATVKRATEAGKKPTAEDLGALVADSSFLNVLQKDVSRWIREIQKVHMCS